jgi:hypothetical protein
MPFGVVSVRLFPDGATAVLVVSACEAAEEPSDPLSARAGVTAPAISAIHKAATNIPTLSSATTTSPGRFRLSMDTSAREDRLR